MGLDRAVLELIADHRSAWATAVTRTVADVGMSTGAYVAAVVLCAAFGWAFRAWRVALAAPVAAFLAITIDELVKNAIGRPRPPHDLALLTSTSFSMPSSIAAMTSAAALPVILAGFRMATFVGRTLVVVLIAATLGVGVSMVYLGAHWLTDVLAGWVLGGLVGGAVYRVIAGPFRRRATGPG